MKKIILLIICLLFCSISTNAQTIIKFKGNKNSIIKNYKLEYLGEERDKDKYGKYKYKETFKIEGLVVDKNNKPIVNEKIYIKGTIGLGYTNIKTDSNGKFKQSFCIEGNMYTLLSGDNRYIWLLQKYVNITFAFSLVNAYVKNGENLGKIRESYKDLLEKGEDIYDIPNPVVIIYQYPFDKCKKIIPYDKNDDAQLIEVEDSKSNVIVLDTINLSGIYFKQKKANALSKSKKRLEEAGIENINIEEIVPINGKLNNDWEYNLEKKILSNAEEQAKTKLEKQTGYDYGYYSVDEIICDKEYTYYGKNKIQKVKNNWKELVNKEIKKQQQLKWEKQQEIKRWKQSVHVVQKQLNRCPNCYRYSLQISLLMKTGDPNHTWLMMYCPQCEYYNEELSGF